MTLDATRLQVSVQEQERWRRRLSITVPAAIVREAEQKAARQLASRARLKGFRKGRVPVRVIESRFGGALRREALDRLVADAYEKAITSQQLRPITQGEIENLRYEPEQDLTFDVTLEVQPVIELARLGGFVVEHPRLEVTEEHVAQVLERVRQQHGVWRPVEEGQPVHGDYVAVEITRLDDGEGGEARPYDFVLGQGEAIPDVEAAIMTLAPGGEGEFDIRFPEDLPDEARRGRQERVRIRLRSRRVLDLPAVDDELARQAGDFETLEELRAKIREDLEKEAEERADQVVRNRLLDLVLEANPFEVPASMIERYLETVLGAPSGVSEERLEGAKRQLRPEAERAVKSILVIDRIADVHGLAATEEDIDQRIEEIAAANNTSAAKVYASLQKAGRLEAIERELTEKKVFQFLKDQSEIT